MKALQSRYRIGDAWGSQRASTPASSYSLEPSRRRISLTGFSLIELLAVMAVIIVMMGMLLPSISGFNSTAGRRGAVNTVMNTFEQARVAALEAGRPVYVVFARPNFPDQDAIMVLRETEDGTGPYEQLCQWRKLPKGVLLHSPTAGNNLLKAGQTGSDFTPARFPANSPVPKGELGLLVFNEQGAVTFPTGDKSLRKLILSEGVRGAGGTEALISDKKQAAGGFEIISIAQYTGRAQLDVTTVQ